MPLGLNVVHPFTQDPIPVYAAEYVVGDYGTSAVMGMWVWFSDVHVGVVFRLSCGPALQTLHAGYLIIKVAVDYCEM